MEGNSSKIELLIELLKSDLGIRSANQDRFIVN